MTDLIATRIIVIVTLAVSVGRLAIGDGSYPVHWLVADLLALGLLVTMEWQARR